MGCDEGWSEGMSQMVIDDKMWSRLEKLLPKPKGCHGKNDRLFMTKHNKVPPFVRIAVATDR